MDDVNENWSILVKRLKYHLATIESQQAHLEEDERIEGSTPAPSPELKKVLEEYTRSASTVWTNTYKLNFLSELNAIYQLLSEGVPNEASLAERVTDASHFKRLITQRCQNLDDIFKKYTVSPSSNGNLWI
jgi:hypothetical protein